MTLAQLLFYVDYIVEPNFDKGSVTMIIEAFNY